MSPEDVRVFLFAAEIASTSLEGADAGREEFTGRLRVIAEVLQELVMQRPPERPAAPAVPIEESVFPDYLICLEDGHRKMMLRRHLRVAHNMGPDQYRARWGLPRDYPLVAPNYSKQSRKRLANRRAVKTAGAVVKQSGPAYP